MRSNDSCDSFFDFTILHEFYRFNGLKKRIMHFFLSRHLLWLIITILPFCILYKMYVFTILNICISAILNKFLDFCNCIFTMSNSFYSVQFELFHHLTSCLHFCHFVYIFTLSPLDSNSFTFAILHMFKRCNFAHTFTFLPCHTNACAVSHDFI